MESEPVYVVSDIHLGAVPEGTERAFRRFLEHMASEASFLLIDGDLFRLLESAKVGTILPRGAEGSQTVPLVRRSPCR